MSTWPHTDDRIIERHLDHLRLRHSNSLVYYRQALRSFQEAVRRHQRSPRKVDRKSLEAWLRNRTAHWPQSTLLHRAGIVNRFLDFLVQEGLIVSNPIADLRAEYRARSDKEILRALSSPDPNQALESLRQFQPFGSVLGDVMRNHVALMQARGYRYQTHASRFQRFDRFLQAHPELAGEPVSVMVRHWSAARPTASHAAECDKLVCALTKAVHRLDPGTAASRADTRLRQQVERLWRQPHIYSPEEVRRFLDIALTYPSPRAPLRPISLYTMLVLAYCAGVRLGELSRLNLADVDLQAGTITVRETKFFKSRILPLTDSALSALQEYLIARRKAKAPQGPDSGLFWHDKGNGRYTRRSIAGRLVDVLRQAGVKPSKGRTGPRIHDLRHSFVVNRILEWYRAGINPQDKLSFLATYLGHRDIHSTLVYITVTQEILQQANERFRKFGSHCLHVSEGMQ